jgi:carbonic anhydrase
MPRTFAPDAVAPGEALAMLRDGNRRFVRGEGTSLRRWHPGLVDGQWPFAILLGCSDSRAPAEYVFDQGLGDLFVIRVAGPVVAPSIVGSIEFAASQFGTRLIVVMGHTLCGAVSATVRALERGGAPESRNLKSIVDRIAPGVQPLDVAKDPEARLSAAVQANAVACARALRTSSPILADLLGRDRIAIVASVFDLATGVVTFLDVPHVVEGRRQHPVSPRVIAKSR